MAHWLYLQKEVDKIVDDANALLLKQAKELEDTKEALRRCRLLLASERELNERLSRKLLKDKPEGIYITWVVSPTIARVRIK